MPVKGDGKVSSLFSYSALSLVYFAIQNVTIHAWLMDKVVNKAFHFYPVVYGEEEKHKQFYQSV